MAAKRAVSLAAIILALIGLARSVSHAQTTASFPLYKPERQVSGVIRIWGHGSRGNDIVGRLVRSWEDGFRKYEAGVEFDTSLLGDSSAIGGLYTGAADIALMGRELLPIELDAYNQMLQSRPFEVEVMTGSLDMRDHSVSPLIFVHKDNPLSRLTLPQLEAIFGAGHSTGQRISKWGELGLTGDWADKPIHLYGFAIREPISRFFEQAALGGSGKWNNGLQEVTDTRGPTGVPIFASERIANALALDRFGIALSTLEYRNSGIKPVALARGESGPWYEASKKTLINRTYPLTRIVSMFVNRVSGKPIDPCVKEYLLYVLSREGQEAIVRDGGYLPLDADMLREQRRKLE